MLNREQRLELREYRKKLIEESLQRKMLVNRKCDFGLLEELIQKANDNPALAVTVTLADGTVLELKTTRDDKKVNPLFTAQAFEE